MGDEARALRLELDDLRFDVARLRASADEKQDEILSLGKELAAAHADREKLLDLTARYQRLEEEHRNLQSEHRNLQSEHRNLQSECGNLQSECGNLQAQVQAFQSATTWRATAPLRAALSAIEHVLRPMLARVKPPRNQ